MYMDFKGKTAFITGGAQGIGKECCTLFAGFGAKIVVADYNLEGGKKVANMINADHGSAVAVKIDVSNKNSVETAVAEAVSSYGSIDFLVNCAGLVIADVLHDIKEEDWDRVMDVDLKGTFLVGQAVTREMAKKRYGKVVFISSVSAQDAEYGIASYCVAKAGVNMLTHCFAVEMAEYGINVNSVNPASINTQLMQDAFRTRALVENMTEEDYRKKYCSAFPLGRIGEPKEVALLCAILCSDELAFMDGENVLLTGGKVMRM